MARMRLFTALEDLAEDSTVYGDTPYGEEVIEATNEITEDAGKAGDLIDVVDDAQDSVNTLEAIKDSLDKGEEVGINDVAIGPTIIAVEALYRDLGIQHSSLPALESLDANNKDAVKALKISLEEKSEEAKGKIRQMLDKAWKFIKELFEKVVNAIKDVFVPGAKKLLKLTRELKVNEVKGDKEFKDNRIYKAFATRNGEKITGETIVRLIDGFSIVGETYNFNKIEPGENDKIEYTTKDHLVKILGVILKSENNAKYLKNNINEIEASVKDLLKKDKEEKTNVDEEIKKEMELLRKRLKMVTVRISAGLSYAHKNYKALKKSESESKE